MAVVSLSAAIKYKRLAYVAAILASKCVSKHSILEASFSVSATHWPGYRCLHLPSILQDFSIVMQIPITSIWNHYVIGSANKDAFCQH